jgi:hypothetical protein
VLSIALVRPFGIVGDAFGTAIPLTLTCLLFLPNYLCHVLGLKVRTFLVKAYTRPVLLCAPMIGVLLLMRSWFIPHTLLQLVGQTLVAGAVYVGFVYYFMFVRGPLGQRSLNSRALTAQQSSKTEVSSYQPELSGK